MGRTPYSVHPGVEMTRSWVDSLKEKTGRTLEEWIALIDASGPPTEKERRDWLKTEHKLGTNSAGWLAARCEGMGKEDEDPESYLVAASEWVDAMFSGKKAGLRPVYDALLKVGRALGDDVKVCPCRTIVPLYRRHVFAQIKPTTNTRIDFALALGDLKAAGHLIDTGGFAKKDRITHRIPITRIEQGDCAILGNLR
jgi:Domain of unknown function (DUF5655)/Domain of unknown function (DUF4287)